MFTGKSVLITGVCGTVGSELIHQLLSLNDGVPDLIIGIDNNESALFYLAQKYSGIKNVSLYVCDVREREMLLPHFYCVNIVFHCAALKHVILCEKSPNQTISTNISGIQNIISVSTECNVEKVIFTSSDKAVNPTNVMGTSKLMGERLITAANHSRKPNRPIFVSTRFGNVLGSNGSVVPIFKRQISEGGPITLTDTRMTRFVMSVKQSVELLIESYKLACGGEVFITKMPVVKIQDLAVAMIEELSPSYGFNPSEIQIVEIGSKPGEKLYEELMSDEELSRTVELDNFFSVLPAFRNIYNDVSFSYSSSCDVSISEPYNSSNSISLTIDEIKSLLKSYKLI